MFAERENGVPTASDPSEALVGTAPLSGATEDASAMCPAAAEMAVAAVVFPEKGTSKTAGRRAGVVRALAIGSSEKPETDVAKS